MKKVTIVTHDTALISPAVLEDFSLFEEKMIKMKYFKALKQRIDKSDIAAAIEALGLEGKKITAKRVKKLCKKTIMQIIEEVER